MELTEQVREELLVDKLEEIDIPVYFPKYLPKGYTISNIEIFSDCITFKLENKTNYISIIQSSLNVIIPGLRPTLVAVQPSQIALQLI